MLMINSYHHPELLLLGMISTAHAIKKEITSPIPQVYHPWTGLQFQIAMELPTDFVDCEAYFREAVNFLGEFEWLYNFPVTEVLVHNVLDKVPQDWAAVLQALSNEELNLLPGGFVKDSWPSTLVDFCKRCMSLRIPTQKAPHCVEDVSDLPQKLKLGLSPKKHYEICTLALFVNKECKDNSISRILDVGSGLGYLGQVLHHRYGYRVLGLESDSTRVKTAIQRQMTLCSSPNVVKYVTCHVLPSSVERIQRAVDVHLGSADVDLDLKDSCGEDREFSKCSKKVPGWKRHNSGSLKELRSTELCPGCKMIRNTSNKINCTEETCVKVLQTSCLDGERVEENGGDFAKPEDLKINQDKFPLKCSSCEQLAEQEGLPLCMVGLHACGDLTVDATNIFLQLPKAQLLILMPCCYHKMSTVAGGEMQCPSSNVERFHKFPLSGVLKSVFSCTEPDPGTFLQRPFLRLAAQQTPGQWARSSELEHKAHSLHVMARAILELLAHQEGYHLRKRRRRGVTKKQFTCFESYIESALERFEFYTENGLVEDAMAEIRLKAYQLWERYSLFCPLMEAVTALQTMLQTLTEQLILLDRICFLKESSDDKLDCDIVEVFDESISPRCMALVARKCLS